MRGYFDEQLELLNVELITLGAFCEDAIAVACKAIFEQNETLGKQAKKIEANIDKKEREIESMCLNLLLKQQPVAKDLRVISAALKMISDMERIGDQAYDIADLAKYISVKEIKEKEKIKEMANATIKMVTDSIESFVKKDIALADEVILSDDIVDKLFNDVKIDIITALSNGSTDGELYVDLLMVVKYLERIGDHATNIAEWVKFSILGTHEMGL